MYDPKSNTPVSRQYWFNYDPTIRQTENEVFLSFVRIDDAFQMCLKPIKDFLIFTDAVRADSRLAETLFQRRVEKLQEIYRYFHNVTDIFTKNVVNRAKDYKDIFPTYVQSMAGWGLDGMGGIGGAEALTFALLDEFFDLSGKSAPFTIASQQRSGMVRKARELLNKMANDHQETRFDSFLGLSATENSLTKAKDEIIHAIYVWRLGHARTTSVYMEKSTMSAGGTWSDHSLQKGETIAETVLIHGQERARETAQKISNWKCTAMKDDSK